MISLMDHVRKKDLPPELKCRQVRLNAETLRMSHAKTTL